MGFEALKQQFLDGKLTKEEFAAQAKEFVEKGEVKQEDVDAVLNQGGQAGGNNIGLDIQQVLSNPEFLDFVNKQVQSEADKVRTKAAQEKKLLEQQLDQLKTDKMTEEQKAQYERQKLEDALKEKERELNAREVAIHTVDKLTEAKLPLSFKGFLARESVEETDKAIAAFQTAWADAIKTAVDERFKQSGSDPGKGKQGGGTKKWSDMTMTEQGQLYRTDPAEAKRLAAADGMALQF